jgi:hypothetical protein
MPQTEQTITEPAFQQTRRALFHLKTQACLLPDDEFSESRHQVIDK